MPIVNPPKVKVNIIDVKGEASYYLINAYRYYTNTYTHKYQCLSRIFCRCCSIARKYKGKCIYDWHINVFDVLDTYDDHRLNSIDYIVSTILECQHTLALFILEEDSCDKLSELYSDFQYICGHDMKEYEVLKENENES